MKKLLRIFLWIVFFALILAGGTWIYLASITPDYSGEVKLESLDNDSKVTFDQWGIPHIEAESEEDLYRTFGEELEAARFPKCWEKIFWMRISSFELWAFRELRKRMQAALSKVILMRSTSACFRPTWMG